MTSANGNNNDEIKANILKIKAQIADLQDAKADALQEIILHNKVLRDAKKKNAAAKAAGENPAPSPEVEQARKHVRQNAHEVIELSKEITKLEKDSTQLEMQMYANGAPRPAAPDETLTVLLMTTNAEGDAKLNLDNEVRAIQENIRKSAHRDNIKFETRPAAQPLDLMDAINDVNPQVVQISGHGLPGDKIIMRAPDGKPSEVPLAAIVQVMMTAESVRLVLFNMCFTDDEAKAVVKYVEAAIGMSGPIGDDAAMVYFAQFYLSTGYAKSVKVAFEQAKAALMLLGIKEENTPVLYVKEGLDPAQIFLIKGNDDKDKNK